MTKERPKILLVFHGSQMESGGTKSLMDIVQGLYATGRYNFEAVFPYEKGSASDWFEERGLPVYICHYGLLMWDLTQPKVKYVAKFPLFVARHLRSWFEANALAKELDDHDIDIVYTNTSTVLFGGMLGKLLGVKQIWHIREFRILDHRFTYYLGDRRLKRYIARNADQVLTVSQAVKDYHSDVIDPAKVHVTYNSYPKSFIDPKHDFNTDRSLNLLLAGDIKPGKGQLEALQALAEARAKGLDPGFTIHFAGAEPDHRYSQTVRSFVSQHELQDAVVFHGFVKDMLALREQMDIGLVSSTNEAFGRTMIEGMLSMLAMIGRDSGGTSEQIEPGVTGLLYDGAPEDLASQYLVLDRDRSLLQRLAMAGFDYSVERFTNGYAAKVTEETIERMMANG